MLKSLILSLGLTLLLEGGTSLVIGLRRRDLLVVALVNTVTNPLVVLTLNLCLLGGIAPPWYLVAALELGAVAAEGFLYRSCLSQNKYDPFLLSILLNAISFTGGLLLQ